MKSDGVIGDVRKMAAAHTLDRPIYTEPTDVLIPRVHLRIGAVLRWGKAIVFSPALNLPIPGKSTAKIIPRGHLREGSRRWFLVEGFPPARDHSVASKGTAMIPGGADGHITSSWRLELVIIIAVKVVPEALDAAVVLDPA